MRAEFGIKRESNNSLFYKEWENDAGIFHFHSQIELYFVNDGEMEVIVGEQSRMVKGGEMSVALSYVPHGYRTPKASKSGALIIPTYLCGDFVRAVKERTATDPFIYDTETVKKIKNCINEMFKDGVNEIERQGYIYVILGTVMGALRFEQSGSTNDGTLASKILLYVNENFRKNITPSDIATHLGYSQSYVSRYFRERFNLTLSKYLTITRLKNVIMLLHENKYSVTYCALESGFSSMRTFYRAFSEEMGCSPKEYFKEIIK